jgi:hypothetical protein
MGWIASAGGFEIIAEALSKFVDLLKMLKQKSLYSSRAGVGAFVSHEISLRFRRTFTIQTTITPESVASYVSLILNTI